MTPCAVLTTAALATLCVASAVAIGHFNEVLAPAESAPQILFRVSIINNKKVSLRKLKA